jgi:PII-like signaling protein
MARRVARPGGVGVKTEGEGQLLRIFIGESDTWHGKPLYEAIVMRAREEGLAGTTVVRGLEGYGASSHVHTTRLLELSSDLPIVIEIVDRQDRIEAFLPALDEMVTEGLVTSEPVHVLVYRARERS